MPAISAPDPDQPARSPGPSPLDPDQAGLDLRDDPVRRAAGLVVLALLSGLAFVRELVFPSRHLPHLMSAFVATCCVFFLLVVLRRRSMGVLLRLDEEGLTVRDQGTIPWSDLSEVRYVKATKWTTGGVVFVGRPGVDLPVLPPMIPFPRAHARAARLARRYGSPLVAPLQGLSTEAAGIVAAVQRLSTVPVLMA